MGGYDWPLEGLDSGRIQAAIDKSFAVTETYIASARKAFQANRHHETVAWAQLVADIAWNAHTGRYVLPELENMLLGVAQGLGRIRPGRVHPLPAERSSRKRILHVLTIAYQTGGHTRAVERWIQNTSHEYVHGVVNTSLGDFTPQWLTDVAEKSGGWLLQLDRPFADLLRKARELRDIAHDWADIVVLHTHPNDPLPVLAFGVDSGPPVILFNHADHVFWLGASIADVVAEIRPAGQDLSLRRRGVRASSLLPIPLIAHDLPMTRSTARQQLGIDEKTTVLLTIAAPYKLTPFGGYDFLSLNRKVIEANPDTVLVVVGPNNSGKWAEECDATNGRIRAVGERHDIGLFYAAADIYVDSFPYGSTTAMLDAGMHGIASVGLRNPLSRVNLAGDITQERCTTHQATREDYVDELNRLIGDISYRRLKGAELARAVREDHLLPGWNNYLDRLMAILPQKHAPELLPDLQHETDMDDFFLTCVQQESSMSVHVYFFLSRHIRYLSAGARFSLAVDNFLRRGIFADKKLRMKTFRSYRIPSGRDLKKWLRGLRRGQA